MSPFALVRLIRSLSSPEKRYFKLHSKTQAGSKEYLTLFDFIEKSKTIDMSAIREEFKTSYPAYSWLNNCNYLGKMLTDNLISAKTEKDGFFKLLHSIMEVRVLQERSLPDEAFKQLKKIQQQAAKSQFHSIEYLSYRYELNHFAENDFQDITDEMLVKRQMKAKEVLKNLNHIQDHYSLFELLKFRLIHSGKIVSEEGKKRLNDLMLSEMVLVANKSKSSFSSQKLHLLFQSFFFTDIGDYHSALKSFYDLNCLFEKNEHLLEHPPHDYLSALNGMLDSLAMLNNEKEIHFYIEKLKRLDQPAYPEYFRYQVRKTVAAQQVSLLLQNKKFEQAKQFVESMETDLLNSYSLVNEEQHNELHFCCSRTYFELKDFRKAHLFIREIMSQGKLAPQLLISKAIRLLNIITYYEKGELPHLEYEVRSYKRYFQQHTKLLKIEKLIFKIIKATAANKRLLLVKPEQRKIYNEAVKLSTDRYEKQLLKYFDFTGWIMKIVERK